MQVTVRKLTDISLLREACAATIGGESRASLGRMYLAEHSPIRTQLFWIRMDDIPSFVSTHFVRHKFGVEHFVRTNRDDRGGSDSVDRWTPVTHCMLLNAQALINMARKRLCNMSHRETVNVFREILKGVHEADPELFPFLVPECVYRKMCPEPRGCGWYERSYLN